MARREYRLNKNCAQEGCKEVGRWTYTTQRDLATSYEFKNEYRCVRHTRPQEVLSQENTATEKVLTAVRGAGGNLYFGGFGFVHGPGFKVFADDFPEGARLIVSARIELPNA